MNIDNIVKNVLKESLDERVKEITKKIIKESSKGVCEQCGSTMKEGKCLECESTKDEFFEEDNSNACETYNYHLNTFGEDDERTLQYKDRCESSKDSSGDELEEELHGGQHKLDVAKPKGKLTSADFRKLRSRKGKKSEENEAIGYYDNIDSDDFNERTGGMYNSSKNDDTYSPEAEYVPFNKRRVSDIEDIDHEEVKPSFLNRMKNKFKSKEMDEEFFYSDEEDSEMASDREPTYVGRGLSDNKERADITNKILGSFNDEHGWYDETDNEYMGDFDFDYDEEEFEDFDSLMGKYGDKQSWFERGNEGKKFFDKYQEKYQGAPFRVRKRREMDEEETQEGNAFTGPLSKARKTGEDKFEVGGKKFKTNESIKSKLTLTESELIDLIESIVLEEKEKKVLDKKRPKGYTEYEKNVKLSKKENDDYIKSVTQKLKDYLKGGSKGEYETDPKHFPKGNGELAKMDKKAYVPSEAVEEFIEDFAYSPGMENLKYDEIKPNDEWLDMNIEGDSKTGNSSEYANAEKTDLGKKINAKRKRNLYGVEKDGSYKRVKQPVDSAGEGKGEKTIKNMFKKLGENTENKTKKVLNEEIDKISHIITYNRKTQ